MTDLTAIVNATIYPVSSRPIEGGTLLIAGGKIKKVGMGVPVPPEAKVHDAKGKVILPGFVDEHTHVGMWPEWYGPPESDGNEGSNPVTPEVRALDSVWPDHTAFADARAGGVTTNR